MIIKSLSRKSGIKQVINYLFKDEKKLRNTENKQLVIRKNVRTRSLDKWVKEFEKNEELRIHKRSNSVKVYHTVLSFSNKDKEQISEKMLRDISKQFMSLRGNDNLYVGTAHYDHDHVHLHFVISGTKYLTGEASRQSKTEFQKLKLLMDSYQKQKYPELVNSLPRHGKSKDLKSSQKEKSQRIRCTQKEALLKCLDATYTKAKSLDDFLLQLKAMGHEPYSRGGRLTGVKFEGDRKFRFQTIGYDKDKIAKLEANDEKEKQELDELSEIRENAVDRDMKTNDRGRELEEDEEKDISNEADDSDDDSDIK